MKLSIKEKNYYSLLHSFLWMLHWGTNIANLIIDTLLSLLRNGVKLLPFGL